MDAKRRAFLSFSSGFETRARHDEPAVQKEAFLALPKEWRSQEPSDDKAKKLLSWFKGSYFTWINQPPCEFCHTNEKMKIAGSRRPQTVQEHQGLASLVEVYSCEQCHANTSFPRFNHPLALFQSRSGRCGEWANAFCALAIASGFQTRYILDLTDHVWAELFSPEQKRWIHCDPCENVFDAPLMYESGWNKKISYVFAFESGGKALDVTRRYSRKWNEAEMIFQRIALVSTTMVNSLELFKPSRMVDSELLEFELCRWEMTQLRRNKKLMSVVKTRKPEEERGRISGSEAWKQSRGEQGNNQKKSDKEIFQAKFKALCDQGMSPNKAALQALEDMKKQ